MSRPPAEPGASHASGVSRRTGLWKSLWRKIRKPLARSLLVKHMVATLLVQALRVTYRTNREVPGSDDAAAILHRTGPVIAALWHGQHLLGPCAMPPDLQIVAMFSRSADAELNALVGEKMGFQVVRGSGGRMSGSSAKKGGARALLALKKALGEGKTVAMIADIPHGVARQAGLGVVTLAKISGRPILPVAIATSRRRVLEASWDRTTINLPFGRRSLVIGQPVHVPHDADQTMLEAKRREVTASLDAVTQRSYRLVDGVA